MTKAKPRKQKPGFAFAVGRTYLNRAGAKVRVEEIVNSGHQMLDAKTYKPIGPATFLILKVIGTNPSLPARHALCGCHGRYFPHDENHPLDLVKEVK